MSLITCDNVEFAYEGRVVVSELNFQVQAKDYLCVVGANGSGKSTLIKGILGLKKLARGQISFSPEVKKTDIGYLPQQTEVAKDFPASVQEIVLSGCANDLGYWPFYTQCHQQLSLAKMELLGIAELKEVCYRELSRGQQQRVLLARALCAAKKILVLDEPATGLDPIVTRDLYEFLQQVNEQLGLTIIMISHDVQAAVRFADHILHLDNRQLFFGRTCQYLDSEIGRSFLGGERVE